MTKGYHKILAMDLSLNLPAMAVLEIRDNKPYIVDTYYVDNKKKTKAKTAEKLSYISDQLIEIYQKHTDITHMVREKGFSRFANTTQLLFRVVGVSDLIGYDIYGCKEIEELSTTEVKRFVAGYGKADKSEVEDGVRELLNEDQKDYKFYSDDVSDAVAVGLAYYIKRGLLK